MRLLAECFEELGGAPKVVLADRMGCLKGGVVANVVVPTRGVRAVRDALRVPARLLRGGRPGVQGGGRSAVPLRAGGPDRPRRTRGSSETEANDACRAWCAEVNGREHSTIAAVPDERLVEERKLLRPLPSLRPPLRRGERRRVDKLATVRIGSARYSVPRELVGVDVDGHRRRRRGAHRTRR